jgi:peptidoglycan/LPS O-acetylase OafA/YrhL
VDIFFVISGYLITALIAGELAAGTFSLQNFWERRIRRIVPAATVTVAVCLVVGFFLMLPSDFADLGRSAVAQALVAANFHFYSEAGYFSAPADAKPLLHFWSLAVEEQFYLIFPFLLVVLHRWRADTIFRGVALVAVASFVLSAVGVRWFPDATFYLLPTRAWELAVGALLALRGTTLPLPEQSRIPLGWLGLAMMVAPLFLYDSETPFPGLAAVPPCIGAMLVIWSTAARDSVLKKLLSLQPVVFVGLISYSLYLWHWPVKVFSHYWFTGIYSPVVMRLLVVAVSFGLAWISWRYVELPFRNKHRRVALRPLLAGAVGASVLTLVLGAFIAWRDG